MSSGNLGLLLEIMGSSCSRDDLEAAGIAMTARHVCHRICKGMYLLPRYVCQEAISLRLCHFWVVA